MLRLFYSPGSCALACHIALEEAGAPFEAVRLDLKAGKQREAPYLALNPKGRVPALATPRGVLTENPAILLFIAQSYPQARLAPLDDPFALAKAQAFNAYLCATLHVAFAHAWRGYRWADEPEAQAAMRRKAPHNVAECFGLIEREMLAGPWVAGADYGICDPYLFTFATWLEGAGVDSARLPKVKEHMDRMHARPAVQRALARERG